MKIHSYFLPVILVLALAGVSPRAQAILLDFQAANSVTDNFRLVFTPSIVSQQTDLSGNSYMRSASGANTTSVSLYDANGANAGISSFAVSQTDSLSVSFKFEEQSPASCSFGIYIQNAGTNNAYLALISINSSGNLDGLKFSNAVVAGPNTNAAGTLVDGSWVSNTTNFITSSAATDAQTIPFDNTATFLYGIDGANHPTFSLSVFNGTTTTTSAYTLGSLTAFTNVEVGFRMNGGGSNIRMDDLSMTTVPEPTTWALLCAGFGMLWLLGRKVSIS